MPANLRVCAREHGQLTLADTITIAESSRMAAEHTCPIDGDDHDESCAIPRSRTVAGPQHASRNWWIRGLLGRPVGEMDHALDLRPGSVGARTLWINVALLNMTGRDMPILVSTAANTFEAEPSEVPLICDTSTGRMMYVAAVNECVPVEW